MSEKGCKYMPNQELLEKYALKIAYFVKNELYNYCKQNNKKIKIQFIGGEVTYFDLIKIIKIIGPQYISLINIPTNLSQSIDYFVKLNHFCNICRIDLRISASYHKEFGNQEDFIQKIKLLLDNQIKVRVNIFVNQDTFDLSFIQECIKQNLYIHITKERLNISEETLNLTQEQMQFLYDLQTKYQIDKGQQNGICIMQENKYLFNDVTLINNFINNGGLNPYNWICTAGNTSIRIEPNGDVCRAGCYYLRNNLILGNLNEDNYQISLPKENVICKLDKDKKCKLCWNINLKKGE
jgi:MoaA/NifB/PqqE/SkfB family radical SAM enzyme